MRRNILLIEDNRDICNLVSLHLQDMGYGVEIQSDGERGLAAAVSGDFGLIVLDLMLPGINGLEICAKLRSNAPYVPILMLTARSSEVDRVVGLETGADDYLTKPFSIHELLARVKAIFRRVDQLSSNGSSISQPVTCGEFAIDIEKREVKLAGTAIDLTPKEFDLLTQFASNPGRVYSRKQLLDLVWGNQHDGYEYTVNSHINRLRNKIETDSHNPQYLLTVWGVGYKFKGSADQPL